MSEERVCSPSTKAIRLGETCNAALCPNDRVRTAIFSVNGPWPVFSGRVCLRPWIQWERATQRGG